MQEMLTKIILVLIQTPMAVLLYIQGVMGFWAHEMTLDMIKQGFIFGTTIATFAVALLKWWRDRLEALNQSLLLLRRLRVQIQWRHQANANSR